MDVRACKSCGKLFNYLSGPPICMACKDELENKFQQVKEYIRENRTANIQQISEENDVPIKQIQQWVREERLEFSSGIDAGVVCENCGTPISSGRFCDKCKASMINDLTAAGRRPVVEQPKPEKRQTHENKMRFLNQQ